MYVKFQWTDLKRDQQLSSYASLMQLESLSTFEYMHHLQKTGQKITLRLALNCLLHSLYFFYLWHGWQLVMALYDEHGS